MSDDTKKVKTWPAVLRNVVGGGLALYLIWTVAGDQWPQFVPAFKQASASLLALGFLLYASALFFGICRWKLLLDVQGITLSLWAVTRLSLIGVFSSLVIPGGSVSGDVVKIACIARHAKGKGTEALMTIMLDRILGLMGLLLVASVSVVVSLNLLPETSSTVQAASYVVALGSAGAIIGMLCVEFHQKLEALPGVRGIIALGERRLPERLKEIVIRLVRALDLYRNSRIIILKGLLLSVCTHSVLALSLFALGRGFNETVVGLKGYFVTTQIGNLAGIIPLTSAGIGTRDKVISWFLQAFGASETACAIIPIVYTLTFVALGLLGGFVFFATRGDHTERVPPPASEDADARGGNQNLTGTEQKRVRL